VVNDRRKANGFALTDRVAVELFSTDRIVGAANRHAEAIKPEVLATTFEAHEELLETPPDATIDGEPLWLDVRRS
jgi:hypothetical protein